MTRHRLDVFPLCAGVLFMALAIGFLLDGLDVWNARRLLDRPRAADRLRPRRRAHDRRPIHATRFLDTICANTVRASRTLSRRGAGSASARLAVGTKRPETGCSELHRTEIRSPTVGAVTERHTRPVANAAGQRNAHNRTGEGRAPAGRARARFEAPLVPSDAHPRRARRPPRPRLGGVRRAPARKGPAGGRHRHQRPGVVAGVDDRRVREPRQRPRRAAAGERPLPCGQQPHPISGPGTTAHPPRRRTADPFGRRADRGGVGRHDDRRGATLRGARPFSHPRTSMRPNG